MVNKNKYKYSPAELEILNLISSDIITTSRPGGSDDDNGTDNRDDSAWT